jgi:putative ABC transport system permease protein
MSVVIRTLGAPNRVAPVVRGEIRRLDPQLPVADLEPFENVVNRSISQPRFYALLLSCFGALALLLASIGVYGVISYGVAQRRRELALRIALGAGGREIRGLVVGQAARLAAAGVAAGLAGAFALTRLLARLLFGVGAADPMSFGVAAAVLIFVALVAGEFPARRASRLDPAQALRAE